MNDEIIITRSAVQKESQSTSYPSERIDLPSKGYFYSDNDPLSLGYIDMKMMTRHIFPPTLTVYKLYVT